MSQINLTSLSQDVPSYEQCLGNKGEVFINFIESSLCISNGDGTYFCIRAKTYVKEFLSKFEKIILPDEKVQYTFDHNFGYPINIELRDGDSRKIENGITSTDSSISLTLDSNIDIDDLYILYFTENTLGKGKVQYDRIYIHQFTEEKIDDNYIYTFNHNFGKQINFTLYDENNNLQIADIQSLENTIKITTSGRLLSGKLQDFDYVQYFRIMKDSIETGNYYNINISSFSKITLGDQDIYTYVHSIGVEVEYLIYDSTGSLISIDSGSTSINFTIQTKKDSDVTGIYLRYYK